LIIWACFVNALVLGYLFGGFIFIGVEDIWGNGFLRYLFLEFSEFYENIILMIKKFTAEIYGKWAGRENGVISPVYLLL